MPCDIRRVPGGVAMLCSRGPRPRPRVLPCQEAGCAYPHVALCDGLKAGGGTCDRRMCGQHRHVIGRDRDLCPSCWETAGRPRLEF